MHIPIEIRTPWSYIRCMSENTTHKLFCMRCRVSLDARSGYCRGCGTSYLPNHGDPPGLHAEHGFLLDAALSLTDPDRPGMLNMPEDLLRSKATTKPELPIGPPVPDGFDTASPDELLASLGSPHPRHRGMAALRLGMLRNPQISFKLLAHLPDRDPDVRGCMLWALGRSRNPNLSGPLQGFLGVERDPLIRVRIAATLYLLLAKPTHNIEPELAAAIEAAEVLVRADPSPETHFERGLLHLRAGSHLKAVGDFTRTGDGTFPNARALLYRSEAFLMLGKPLFSMDDLLLYPATTTEQLPEYVLHRAALLTLGRQISDAAQAKGLTEYADLFIRRIEVLKKK